MADGLEKPTGDSPAVKKGESIRSCMPNWSCGWGPIVILPCAVLALFAFTWPRWALMWTLAFAIYAGCKWLTWRRTFAPAAPLWKHAGYLFAWPGMDAPAFLGSSTNSKLNRCYPLEWFFALAKLAAGIFLLWGVARFVPQEYTVLTGWIGMIAIVMILHFGQPFGGYLVPRPSRTLRPTPAKRGHGKTRRSSEVADGSTVANGRITASSTK